MWGSSGATGQALRGPEGQNDLIEARFLPTALLQVYIYKAHSVCAHIYVC